MSLDDTQALPFGGTDAPLDAASLARLATDFFRALPGQVTAPASAIPSATLPARFGLPFGVQAPSNIAPAGSPVSGPGGFGPSVPGTPIPQGQLPGTNLIPNSPGAIPSLPNRAPSLLPHAVAGNGLPDHLVSAAPALEPRVGSWANSVPQGVPGTPPRFATPDASHADADYYFLAQDHGVARAPQGAAPIEDRFLPSAADDVAGATQAIEAVPSPMPNASGFYFLDAAGPPTRPVRPASQAARPDTLPARNERQPFDVHAIRRDFPILSEEVNGRPLVWFDNAATTQKPQVVIDRLAQFYRHENSNIHRAAHELAARATDAYEKARETARRFINAPDVDELVFVRGTTEGINLVAKSWGAQHVGAGDEIVVSHLEHHANIVPWQQLASSKGAKLRVIPVDDSGQVLLDEYQKLLSDRTKIVAVTQVSNALGTVVPVREIIDLAHRAGARVLIDGAQSVSHMRVDVQALDADFFVFSGHKVFGPTGIGVVWGRRALLEDMPPWQGGGNMIADVTFEKTTYQAIPNKFEAGTGNIADAVGLGAALEYVERIGIERIGRYEHDLLTYGMPLLGAIPGVRLIGTAQDKASVMSFVLAGTSTEEVGQALNREGIAVRTGHHCAQPILRRFGVEATVRPSLAFYNTTDEIDRLIAVVRRLAGARRSR